MKNLMFKLPWGKVYRSGRRTGIAITTQEIMFKGNPDKYVDSLNAHHHGNLGEALLFLDRSGPEVNKTLFFTQVRNVITNRLAGKKRKDRVAGAKNG
jgi:hypothetical protein